MALVIRNKKTHCEIACHKIWLSLLKFWFWSDQHGTRYVLFLLGGSLLPLGADRARCPTSVMPRCMKSPWRCYRPKGDFTMRKWAVWCELENQLSYAIAKLIWILVIPVHLCTFESLYAWFSYENDSQLNYLARGPSSTKVLQVAVYPGEGHVGSREDESLEQARMGSHGFSSTPKIMKDFT